MNDKCTSLQVIDSDSTQQTWLLIRMIDKFFDLMNVKGPQMAKLKRIHYRQQMKDLRFIMV